MLGKILFWLVAFAILVTVVGLENLHTVAGAATDILTSIAAMFKHAAAK